MGLGSNGFGEGYLGGYSLTAALVFEIVATFLFVVVILGVTQKGSPAMLAGLAIGLTLVVIHIVGIQVTGVSVNPARSFGPAVFAQGIALQQLWLFIVAPLIGAGLAGLAVPRESARSRWSRRARRKIRRDDGTGREPREHASHLASAQ